MHENRSNKVRSAVLAVLLVICLGFQVAMITPAQAQSNYATNAGDETGPAYEEQATQVLNQAMKLPTMQAQALPESVVQANSLNHLVIEGFETGFPSANWYVWDDNTGKEYYWDDDDFKPFKGKKSAWVARGGANGLDPAKSNYPNDMDTWMVYGPIDLSTGLDGAYLEFNFWNKSEFKKDWFFWGASSDGYSFNGTRVTGNYSSWKRQRLDLSDYVGNPTVWIAFIFTSNSSGRDIGAFVDNVDIWTYTTETMTFYSQAANDGWVLETEEDSSVGGKKNSGNTTFFVGDDSSNNQYRGILSFDTTGLPDNALVTEVTLQVKKAGLKGRSPFGTHSGLWVDIRRDKFGTKPALQSTDFQSRSSRNFVGKFASTPLVGDWYTVDLKYTAYSFINKYGTTQFRLRFKKDDNNDSGADYFKFYSGNALPGYQPVLIVEYAVP